MGYINNSVVSVEAILTKKGRELFSKGGNTRIVKYAVSDDGVDYRLWDESHPNGSDQYGSAIENLPMLEATPDETQLMKYKLITLPKSTTRIPLISVGFSAIVLNGEGDIVTITPTTRFSQEDTAGYTATLHNSNYAYLQVVSGVQGSPVVPTNPNAFLTDEQLNQSISVIGFSFKIISKDVSPYTGSSITTNITITGNQTGARITVPVTVYKQGVPVQAATTA